ncbi:MAG: hypothetical protein H0X30_22785 [Anaerolineae bacterium]|nr:hypothetical protein [Anaerolineae bacterium]
MNGISGYRNFILRLTALITLLAVAALLSSLWIGAQTAGDTISAFTTTTVETTDVWVMDVSRMKYVHLQVSGHQDDIPVWSAQERRLTYFPRTP